MYARVFCDGVCVRIHAVCICSSTRGEVREGGVRTARRVRRSISVEQSVAQDAALDVEITNWGVNYGSYFWLASSSNRLRVSMVTWDFDPPKGTLVDSPGNWCVCDQPVLSVRQCDEPHEGSFVVMQNGLLRGSSDQCVHVGADKKLGLMPCPTTRDEKRLSSKLDGPKQVQARRTV